MSNDTSFNTNNVKISLQKSKFLTERFYCISFKQENFYAQLYTKRQNLINFKIHKKVECKTFSIQVENVKI